MIDTHCHLTDPRLLEQLDAVLQRASEAGVTRLITIGTDPADDRAAVALCQNRPNLRCVVGIHPNYTQHCTLADIPQLRDLQSDPSVVALGEMGLDYFHNHADRKHQAALFEAQLQLAQELSRPVVIHSRSAIPQTLAIMARFPSVKAVFHCFTGLAPEAQAIIDAGHLISITGPVTYKKNDDLRAIVQSISLDRLMVETDAPYLSPEPKRAHKTNEPAFVMYTAARIAEIKGLTLAQLDHATTQTATQFFNWP